jgi:hypothetical protein
MILVELWNLTFENEPSRNRDSNVKFAPLGGVPKVAFPAGKLCEHNDSEQAFVGLSEVPSECIDADGGFGRSLVKSMHKQEPSALVHERSECVGALTP